MPAHPTASMPVGGASAVGEHLEARWPSRIAAAGVDGDDDALGAELVGDLGHQLGSVDRRGVHADLVGTGPEQATGVLDAAHAAADGERDEHLLGGAAHHVDDGVARRRTTR